MSSTLATTLAAKAVNPAAIKMLGISTTLLAQSLTSSMGGALEIMNLVGLVLAFGGLLFAAVMFMMGQTERMIYGLIGALIGGLAFLIVRAMFSSSDTQAGALSLGSLPS